MKRNTIFVKALCSLLVICGLFLSGCKQNNKDHNMATKDDFMREAITLSIENVKNVPKDKSGNIIAVYYAYGEILDAPGSSTEDCIDVQKIMKM